MNFKTLLTANYTPSPFCHGSAMENKLGTDRSLNATIGSLMQMENQTNPNGKDRVKHKHMMVQGIGVRINEKKNKQGQIA